MPRASNGVYSLPAGNPVVTGTTIASTWANTTMSDIATAMTDSLDRSGFGGMLASLQLFSGSAGSPGLSWSVETNSGLYRNAAGDFRYSIAATDKLKMTNSQLLFGGTTAPGFSATFGIMAAGATLISVHDTTNSVEALFGTATGAVVGSFTNHVLDIRTNNTQRISVSAAGNVTINAPSSGAVLSVTTLSNQAINFNGPNTGAGYNLNFFDTTASAFRGFIGLGTSTVVGAVATDFAISPGVSGSVVIGTSNGSAICTRFGPNGNVTISAPTSGAALTLSDGGGIVNKLVIGGSAGSASVVQFLGASVAQGKNWLVGNQFNLSDNFEITPSTANGGSTFTTPSLRITGGGAVFIATPTSGVGLTVGGVANSNVMVLNGSSTSGQSFGPAINAGTTSADYAINVQNQSGALAFFRVRGDGAVFGNDGTSLFELGYKDVPQNIQNAGYTLVLSDRGKHIYLNSVGTFTIPSNASVAYPSGTVLTFYNATGSNCSIAITTDTMILAGTATTGTRTLAPNGLATAMKTSSTGWVISGAGLS